GLGAAVVATLPRFACRRGALLAVVGRGPAPPWCPAAASFAEVVGALVRAAVPARWTPIGRAPRQLGSLSQLSRDGVDPRTLPLRLGTSHCDVPRAWIGRHLVLHVPAVVGPADEELGPLRAALVGLVRAAGSPDADAALGAQLLASSFAGCTWIVDARQLLVRPRRPATRAHASALDRVFVVGGVGWSADEVLARATAFDAWISASARLGTAADAGPAWRFEGSAAAAPWPRMRPEPVTIAGPLWSVRAGGREVRRP
ncbi:MAG: hypothetical protein K1X88_30045, partial [Nannocystaceae bacterium]|nr:hypothetical protein [Nannocystaceae bacterium]